MSETSLPTSVQSTLPPPPRPSSAFADELTELVAIFEEGINVCVLRRERDPRIDHFLDEVCRRDVERLLRVPAWQHDLSDLLPDLPESEGHAALRRDVAHLIEIYAELFGATLIGLRLASTRAAMCPRFHVDHIGVRLICTYAGLGTEWLESAHVDRARLGHASAGLPDESSGLLLARGAVRAMRPYDVGLLKGEAWPGNAENGAVHRSPAVPPGDARRVVLTLEGLA